ncbi:MAG TPA: hypothetical protein PKC43_06305 [Phycisphaerales bacterium]|nr:hypothetical protein [Phycisphaerales bacterium]HMP37044.1 hypothetical protein [Phycisphaerales bacterium]
MKRQRRKTKRGRVTAAPTILANEALPSRVIAMSAPITFAPLVASADGAEAMPRLSVVAYTGVQMQIAGWWHPVVIDLAGLRVGAASRPLLREHDALRVVGHTSDIRVEGVDRVVLDGVVSGTGPDAAEIRAAARNGFPWQASVGVAAERVEFLKPGATASANGRTFTGPLYIARASLLREVSIVALGADDSTTARLAASRGKEHHMTFEQWLASLGLDPQTIDASQRTNLQAAFAAIHGPKQTTAVTASAATADDDANEPDHSAEIVARIRRDAAAESARIAGIQAKAAGHPEIIAKAIAEGWTVDKAELEATRASRPIAPTGHVGGAAPAPAAIEASMLLSIGVDQATVGRWYDQPTMEAATDRRMRNVGLHELFSFAAAAAGVHMPSGRFGDDHIRAAFEAERRLIQAQQFSTFSLSGILSNIANKTLLAAFLAVERVAERLSHVRSTSDFKAFTTHRLTPDGRFEEVGPDGELKLASLKGSDYANQLKTRGRVIALTRQAMINDDLGAFTEIAAHLGRAGALALERAWHLLLLSNPGSFFATGNGNYIEGAATAFGIGGLTTLEQKFRDQVDAAGEPIMVSPKFLLVPTSLAVPAQQIFAETRVNETTTTNAAKPANNPHAGKWTPIASPWLNSQALPGSSALAYYLFADPADVGAMQIAFLNGQRIPTIEGGSTDFTTLGMQWRGYWDFGVAMQDHRGAAKSKGEA